MTSHVHMIVGTQDDPLENILRDMKRHTSFLLKQSIAYNRTESRREWMMAMMEKAGRENSNNGDFQFWQQDNHPIELSSPAIMQQKLDYLHMNPVKSGFVNNPEDYVYSSAVDYYTERKGLVDIMRIDPILRTV